MEVRAMARFVRIAPRRARLIIDLVRGKPVNEALAILTNLPNKAARIASKVVKSAASNAESNYQMDPDRLRIVRAYVDEGPRWKRILPKDRGRAFRILKRTSHITVVLEEMPSAPKPRREGATSRRAGGGA